MTLTKPAKASRRQPTAAPDVHRLTRDDWLDAAHAAVVEGGFDAVRVLVLADTLGVTRGSFYWHFSDHAELMAALVARWRERELAVHQSTVARTLDDPVADLEQVLETALAHAGADLGNMRFELALRGLGRRDSQVADLLTEVDRLRMELFAQKFLRLTGDEQSATDLASLFYLSIVGSHQALSRPGVPARLKEYLKATITRYLVTQQGKPGVAG